MNADDKKEETKKEGATAEKEVALPKLPQRSGKKSTRKPQDAETETKSGFEVPHICWQG